MDNDIEIQEMAPERGGPNADEGRFYVFDDIAEILWPGDLDHSNHDAEEQVVQQMGDHATRGEGFTLWHMTPVGEVAFDSEAGAFECHARTREPVEYIVDLIHKLEAKFNAARKVTE